MERNIFVNEVLYCNDEEQLYRVLWISAGQEYGYWIPVDGKMNGIPVKESSGGIGRWHNHIH